MTDQDIDALLERFDLTEPKLQRRIVAKFICDRIWLLDAADRLWADRDADPKDQAACRRLYDAWLALRDARNAAHHPASATPAPPAPREAVCPGFETGGTAPACCDRVGQYNGYGSDGPYLFHCPKSCGCHD